MSNILRRSVHDIILSTRNERVLSKLNRSSSVSRIPSSQVSIFKNSPPSAGASEIENEVSLLTQPAGYAVRKNSESLHSGAPLTPERHKHTHAAPLSPIRSPVALPLRRGPHSPLSSDTLPQDGSSYVSVAKPTMLEDLQSVRSNIKLLNAQLDSITSRPPISSAGTASPHAGSTEQDRRSMSAVSRQRHGHGQESERTIPALLNARINALEDATQLLKSNYSDVARFGKKVLEIDSGFRERSYALESETSANAASLKHLEQVVKDIDLLTAAQIKGQQDVVDAMKTSMLSLRPKIEAAADALASLDTTVAGLSAKVAEVDAKESMRDEILAVHDSSLQGLGAVMAAMEKRGQQNSSAVADLRALLSGLKDKYDSIVHTSFDVSDSNDPTQVASIINTRIALPTPGSASAGCSKRDPSMAGDVDPSRELRGRLADISAQLSLLSSRVEQVEESMHKTSTTASRDEGASASLSDRRMNSIEKKISVLADAMDDLRSDMLKSSVIHTESKSTLDEQTVTKSESRLTASTMEELVSLKASVVKNSSSIGNLSTNFQYIIAQLEKYATTLNTLANKVSTTCALKTGDLRRSASRDDKESLRLSSAEETKILNEGAGRISSVEQKIDNFARALGDVRREFREYKAEAAAARVREHKALLDVMQRLDQRQEALSRTVDNVQSASVKSSATSSSSLVDASTGTKKTVSFNSNFPGLSSIVHDK